MKVWHAASQLMVYSAHAHNEGACALQIIPDRFYVGTPKLANAEELEAMDALRTQPPPVYVGNATIVTAGYDKMTRIWDFNSGKVLNQIAGPSGVICDVKLWRDFVITAATDNDISVHRYEISGNLHLVPPTANPDNAELIVV